MEYMEGDGIDLIDFPIVSADPSLAFCILISRGEIINGWNLPQAFKYPCIHL
jgi:hypothetical protein